MKKLTLLLLLFPLLSFSQNLQLPGGKDVTNISGMLGISFGKTKAECIIAMKAKGYLPSPSTSDYLTFKNVKYGSYKAASVSFYFFKAKFYHGLIIIIPTILPKTYDEYESIVASINEKYDEPMSTREFKTPYSLGDGYEVTAIKGGYTDISDLWTDNGLGMIESKIQESTLITIDYYHLEMTKEALNKTKEKNLTDY